MVASNETVERHPRKRVPDQVFLAVHAHSKSVQEMVEKLGMSASSINARLSRFRTQGIPLKKYSRIKTNKYTPEYIESLKNLYLSELEEISA